MKKSPLVGIFATNAKYERYEYNGVVLVQTCIAAPEQYDAFDKEGKQIGYLRLRHGIFRVEVPDVGGKTVYTAAPDGDIDFTDEEREHYLHEAIKAIKKEVGYNESMDDKLAQLDVAWSLIDGEGLVRVVPTDSFRTGVMFVAELANIAEAQKHDPDVTLTNDKVTITLYSHDENAVTERDYQFARAVDELLAPPTVNDPD